MSDPSIREFGYFLACEINASYKIGVQSLYSGLPIEEYSKAFGLAGAAAVWHGLTKISDARSAYELLTLTECTYTLQILSEYVEAEYCEPLDQVPVLYNYQ